MIKVFIQNKPLILATREEALQFDRNDTQNLLVPGVHQKHLFRYIDNFEKSSTRYDSLIVSAPNFEDLKKRFFSIFTLERAAGGVVQNEKGEILSIFRRGHWDLPKGKMEANESDAETALREVKEETGLNNITLGDFLHTTYHTYLDKNGTRILKESVWFRMHAESAPLTPQHEEDIEQAVWLPMDTLLQKTPIYGNILDVLHKYNEG